MWAVMIFLFAFTAIGGFLTLAIVNDAAGDRRNEIHDAIVHECQESNARWARLADWVQGLGGTFLSSEQGAKLLAVTEPVDCAQEVP